MKQSLPDLFETERLLLQPLRNSDAQFIMTLTNTSGWLKFIGDRNIKSETQAESYIKNILSKSDVKYWKILDKTNQVSVGVVTLIKRTYLNDLDIGFALLPEQMKKGYAFDATKVLLDHCLNEKICQTIYGVTLRENMSSIALLEKLGLTFRKEIIVGEEELLLYSVKDLN